MRTELQKDHFKYVSEKINLMLIYRRGSGVIGQRSENCFLTDYPATDMDPNKHFVPDSGCDVYNRGSYGRGCELDKVLPTSGGWPPVPGQGFTPTVLTTYRPQYGVPPPLSPSPSPYGPRYGPPPSPPVQLFPSVSSESPPKFFPVTPTTRPKGAYVPSLPPTTFFQIPGEYTPVSVRPSNPDPEPKGVFKDLFYPFGQIPTQVPTFIYGTPNKRKITEVLNWYKNSSDFKPLQSTCAKKS